MLSLPGLPRERAGNRQQGRAFLGGEAHTVPSIAGESARHGRGHAITAGLVRAKGGSPEPEAVLSRHSSARSREPARTWGFMASQRFHTEPSWRAPQQKHIPRPPYFANSVWPGERSGSPRAVPECWTRTQWPQEPPADSDRVRCCWPQATGFATGKFGKGRLGMSVHVELPLTSRSPKGQRS